MNCQVSCRGVYTIHICWHVLSCVSERVVLTHLVTCLAEGLAHPYSIHVQIRQLERHSDRAILIVRDRDLTGQLINVPHYRSPRPGPRALPVTRRQLSHIDNASSLCRKTRSSKHKQAKMTEAFRRCKCILHAWVPYGSHLEIGMDVGRTQIHPKRTFFSHID
jgi:hypothetical protein